MAELSLAATQDRILYMLYCVGKDEGKIVVGGIINDFSKVRFEVSGASTLWCERALDELVRTDQAVRSESNGVHPTEISIAGPGIARIESDLGTSSWSGFSRLKEAYRVKREIIQDDEDIFGKPTKRNTFVYRLVGKSHDQADNVADSPGAPASDRIVQLDHNGSPYKTAVAALDDALAKFKADHHAFGNERAAEKEAWVATLSIGRTLLDQTEVGLATLSALLIGPLRRLWEKYNGEIVNAVVAVALGAAITAILKLAGLA
jgi:hypothetical protein